MRELLEDYFYNQGVTGGNTELDRFENKGLHFECTFEFFDFENNKRKYITREVTLTDLLEFVYLKTKNNA